MAFSLLDISVIVIAIAGVAWVLWYFLWSEDRTTRSDSEASS
jgi:hypothetical protein